MSRELDADDYSVLAFVREKWCRRMAAAGGEPPFYFDFIWELKGIWFERKVPGHDVPRRHWPWDPGMYEPGDYSRAALAALAAMKESQP